MAFNLLRKFVMKMARVASRPVRLQEVPVDFSWRQIRKSWGWIQENGRLGPDIEHPGRPVVLKPRQALKLVIEKLDLAPDEMLETCYVQLVNISGSRNTVSASICRFELNGKFVTEQTICIPSKTQPATSYFVDLVLPNDPRDPHYIPFAPQFKPNARNEVLIVNSGPSEIRAKTVEVFVASATILLTAAIKPAAFSQV